MATRITALAFSRFAAGNFQVLREFLAEAAPEPFFNVGTDRIQAANLLFGQFTSTIIFSQKFGVSPEIIEQPAGNLIDTK